MSVRLAAAQHSPPPGSATSRNAAACCTLLRLCPARWEESGEAVLGTGCLPRWVWLGCDLPAGGSTEKALPGSWMLRAPTRSLAEEGCWEECCRQAPELGMRHFPLACCSPVSRSAYVIVSEGHWFCIHPADEALCYLSSLFQRHFYGHET